MYCTNCGKEIPSDARFCGFCGKTTAPQKLICPACGRELGDQMIYCSYCGTKADPGGSQPGTNTAHGGRQTAESGTGRQNGFGAGTGTARTGAQSSTVSGGTNTAGTGRQNGFGTEAAPGGGGRTYQTINGFTAGQNTPAAQTAVGSPVTPQTGGQDSTLLKTLTLSWYPGEVKIGIASATGKLHIYRDRLEFQKTMGSSSAGFFGIVGLAVSASKAKKEAAVIFPMNQIASVRETKYCAVPAMLIEMKNGEKHTFVGSILTRDLQDSIQMIQTNIRLHNR